MNLRILLFLTLLAVGSSAQALKLSIWDRELQTKLGDGESNGNKFIVRLVSGYTGPVVVLFALTDEEKNKNIFQTLKNRYVGNLNEGQLILQLPLASNVDAQTFVSPTTTSSVPTSNISVSKLLGNYKFQVNLK